MMVLDTFSQNMIKKGVTVILSGVDAEMLAVLSNVGLVSHIGRENIFLEQSEIWGSTSQALQRAYMIFGTERCSHCTQFHSQSPGSANS
jgi:SulP family sulfate permease